MLEMHEVNNWPNFYLTLDNKIALREILSGGRVFGAIETTVISSIGSALR